MSKQVNTPQHYHTNHLLLRYPLHSNTSVISWCRPCVTLNNDPPQASCQNQSRFPLFSHHSSIAVVTEAHTPPFHPPTTCLLITVSFTNHIAKKTYFSYFCSFNQIWICLVLCLFCEGVRKKNKNQKTKQTHVYTFCCCCCCCPWCYGPTGGSSVLPQSGPHGGKLALGGMFRHHLVAINIFSPPILCGGSGDTLASRRLRPSAAPAAESLNLNFHNGDGLCWPLKKIKRCACWALKFLFIYMICSDWKSPIRMNTFFCPSALLQWEPTGLVVLVHADKLMRISLCRK